MLQLLTARECGVDPPWLLPRIYQHQRYSEVELSGEREFARGHKSGVVSMDIDRQNGRYVISGGRDKNGTVVIHDLDPSAMVSTDTTGVANPNARDSHPVVAKVLMRPPTPSADTNTPSHAVTVVQWYPHDTGLFTATCADHTLQVWDTNMLTMVDRFRFSKTVYAHSMAPAETHSLIAVGGAECKVTLCDMESGSMTHILRFHSKPVMALCWSPLSDHLLASAGQDNTIALWDVRRASGPLRQLDQHNGSGSANTSNEVTAHDGGVNGLCFTSDGLFLASFGCDNALRLWDPFSGRNTLINYGRIANTLSKQTVQFYCTPHTSSLQPLAVVPSGGSLVMLELMTGKRLKTCAGHYGGVYCVTGHPVEQEFYSGGNDRNILVWAPPPPVTKGTKGRRGRVTLHSRSMGVYQDSWSSDED